MPEYIEREKAIDAIANVIATGFVEDRYITPQELQDLQNELEMLPAADVAPVAHGRWERVPSVSGAVTKVQCSACKVRENLGFEDHKFCPNCGAIMDLKKEMEEK